MFIPLAVNLLIQNHCYKTYAGSVCNKHVIERHLLAQLLQRSVENQEQELKCLLPKDSPLQDSTWEALKSLL